MGANGIEAKTYLINELYDEVDTISEEVIDCDYPAALKAIGRLEQKLRDLKSNIKERDEIS